MQKELYESHPFKQKCIICSELISAPLVPRTQSPAQDCQSTGLQRKGMEEVPKAMEYYPFVGVVDISFLTQHLAAESLKALVPLIQ